MQPPSINSSVSALRFYFTVTLDRPDLSRRLSVVHQPRKLPTVLSIPTGSFPGGFRKPAPVPPPSLRQAGIRNPSQERVLK